MVGGFKVGNYLSYTDVEPELIAEEPGVRVLPAPFFYEKGLFFTLKKKYLPGENKFFPLGGFEVRSANGQIRNYDLDQVIIHPAVIKHKKTLDKMHKRAEKEAKKRERRLKKLEKVNKPKYGKKGRPALSPEEKAKREAEKAEKKARSGGKRGRPKSDVNKPVTQKATGGKRGRPALSDEAKAKKAAEKAAIKARSGGKRGRPASKSKKEPKVKVEGRKRGRPPKLAKK